MGGKNCCRGVRKFTKRVEHLLSPNLRLSSGMEVSGTGYQHGSVAPLGLENYTPYLRSQGSRPWAIFCRPFSGLYGSQAGRLASTLSLTSGPTHIVGPGRELQLAGDSPAVAGTAIHKAAESVAPLGAWTCTPYFRSRGSRPWAIFWRPFSGLGAIRGDAWPARARHETAGGLVKGRHRVYYRLLG